MTRPPTVAPFGRSLPLEGSVCAYTMFADGTGLVRVTSGPGPSSVSSDGWNGNGKRIAYHMNVGVSGTDIFIMDEDGANVNRLTTDGLSLGPALSPNGKQIAFASDRDGDWDLYVMSADGSGLTQVTNEPGEEGFRGLDFY